MLAAPAPKSRVWILRLPFQLQQAALLIIYGLSGIVSAQGLILISAAAPRELIRAIFLKATGSKMQVLTMVAEGLRLITILSFKTIFSTKQMVQHRSRDLSIVPAY